MSLTHIKSHGRRSLEGCSPRGRWESDTTEWLHFHFSLSCTGKGNGNLLQCSCLENPRDGGLPSLGSQSRTRLKWLSSSSSSNNTHEERSQENRWRLSRAFESWHSVIPWDQINALLFIIWEKKWLVSFSQVSVSYNWKIPDTYTLLFTWKTSLHT